MPIIFLFISVFSFAKIPPIIMDNARALYVVDGDSLSLQMRIKGIDTPEKPQKCKKYPNKVINCGLISQKYLSTLLNTITGKLHIEPVNIGYYGRVLVNVYKGGINIGELLVRDGMAFAYGKKYKAAEQFAKLHNKGFWGYYLKPINPKLWRKKHPRKL